MDVAEVINENKLSLIRKYGLEVLVAALLLSNIVLYRQQGETAKEVNALQVEMKAFLKTDHISMIEVIEKNNNLLENVEASLK
jgi:hypothetical protein